MTKEEIKALVRAVPDFPAQGILFRDVTTLIRHGEGFAACIAHLARMAEAAGAEVIAGMEARGFIFGAALATRLGKGFIPVRKAGKLPWAVVREEYTLEYGTDKLEIHRDAIHPGERILVVDDVLATGGTAAAVASLVTRLGGVLAGFAFPIELAFLGGRSRLGGVPVDSLVTYR